MPYTPILLRKWKQNIEIRAICFIYKRPCKFAGSLCNFMDGETGLEKLIIMANIYLQSNYMPTTQINVFYG